MKNHASFKLIARMMTDAWMYGPNGNRDAAGIYARILEMLRPNMILAVVDTRTNDADDFALDVVSRYEVPTTMSAMRHLQVSQTLSEFPDQQHLRSVMIPAFLTAIEDRRPLTDRIAASILDMVTIYDRLILPQRNPAGRSEWCLVLIDVKFLLPTAPTTPLADVDLGILQLLAEGATIKEIAEVSYRSHRTTHHRVERLKARFGARNLVHLVGLFLAAGIADGVSS